MENGAENDVRLTLRIYVEPIKIELDQEGAILITTLQSALPGAFGLYFYDGDCRSSLRFDGKKFLPPGDGWKDQKYYALLGCRPFDYPFGSYANAAKQFERSVNTVQRLLANHNGFVERDIVSIGKTTDQRRATVSHDKIENMQRLLTATTKHTTLGRDGITGDEQTPLEQQFVELARISTAKDSIIAQQRADIKVVNDKLEQKERSVKRLQDDLSKLMESCRAKDKELAFLRGLNQDQKFMCEKVNELKSRLMDRENIITAQKKEIEFLVRKMATLNIEQLPSKETSNLGTASEPVNGMAIGAHESSVGGDIDQNDEETKHLTNNELANALAHTKARNEQLENQVNVADEKYQQLNEVYIAVVAENTKLMTELAQLERETSTNINIKNESLSTTDVANDESKWNSEHLFALKQDLAVSEKRVAKLTRMIHALTESSSNELRAADTTATRNAMKCLLDQMDTKIQITITK
ncbi:hypothetical protein ACH3XW_22840 [Acanthocheilonema viteae]